MLSRRIRVAILLFVLAPATALAFETVDRLPFPSEGRFPAWPGDPERPWTVFAYGGAMYDSNPFRLPSGEDSDMVTRLGFGGRTELEHLQMRKPGLTYQLGVLAPPAGIGADHPPRDSVAIEERLSKRHAIAGVERFTRHDPNDGTS